MPEVAQNTAEALAPIAPPPAAPAAPAAPAEAPKEPKPAESAPAPQGGEPKTENPPEAQGKHRAERKISRLYRQAAEEKARADLLAQQLEQFRPKEAPDTGGPKLEQFSSIEDYEAAIRKHEREKAAREFTVRQQADTAKAQQERISGSWSDAAERGSEKYDDFDEKVGELKPVTPLIAAIMSAENAEDVAYHLATNLAEAQRIYALDPISQVRAIGRLEARLAANPEKPKTPSKAPAPIVPVSGKAQVGSESIADDDDMKTFIRKRNRQLGRVK